MQKSLPYSAKLWELACVGAGLLANTVCQYQMHWLTLRIREQARSHIGIDVYYRVPNPTCTVSAPWLSPSPIPQFGRVRQRLLHTLQQSFVINDIDSTLTKPPS